MQRSVKDFDKQNSAVVLVFCMFKARLLTRLKWLFVEPAMNTSWWFGGVLVMRLKLVPF